MPATQLRRELGKKELFGIAIGQLTGAGVMVLIGYGIAMTGRSVSLAMVLCAQQRHRSGKVRMGISHEDE